MTCIKQLGKDSLVYGLGRIFASGITFFLLPIYTRIFPPADYGTIEMLTVVVGFLSAMLGMGMDTAQSFYFFEQKGEGKAAQARLVSAILQWRLIWGIGIVIIITTISPLLNFAFFSGHLSWECFAVAFAGALFAQVMSQSVEVFRLLFRPWPFVLIIFFQTGLAASLVLILVLGFTLGIFGYFLGTAIASLAGLSLGWFLVREYIDFSGLHIAWWPRLLRFGAPLVLADLATYAINTTDRWFILHYQGVAALGIYALGAKFSLIMTLAVESFRRAWSPIAMDAVHSEDGAETYRMIARLYIGVGAGGVVVLTWLSPWLIMWLSDPAFHAAWPIVGVLAWQTLFYGFYLVASAGIWKMKKTYLSAYLIGAAALINLALNYLLVPEYGGMGAAISTAIAYLFWVIATMWVGECLWRVNFNWRVFFFQIALGVGAVFWLLLQPIYRFSELNPVVVSVAVLILLYSSIGKSHRKLLLNKLSGRWNS